MKVIRCNLQNEMYKTVKMNKKNQNMSFVSAAYLDEPWKMRIHELANFAKKRYIN